MMLRILWIMLAMTLALVAEKFVLVTNKESEIVSLNQTEIQAIYLKKRRFWKETKLIALNLPPKHPLRKDFETHILKMNNSQLQRYWMKEHYKGRRPPYRVESLKSMLLYIKRVKGSIGYIPLSLLNDELKILYQGKF